MESQEKEEFLREVRAMLGSITAYTNHCNSFVSSLQQTCRSDVNFHTIEACKAVTEETKEISTILKRLQVLLKKRGVARMKQM